MKVNIGAGSNRLPGWVNVDLDYPPPDRLDIREPLPYATGEVEVILIEHCLEHVDSADAFRFLKEAHRVLQPSGGIRVCVPSIEQVYWKADAKYLDWSKQAGFTDGTLSGAIASLITGHGHKSVWNCEILKTMLLVAGFKKTHSPYHRGSMDERFQGIDGHHKTIGEHANNIETIVVEGWK